MSFQKFIFASVMNETQKKILQLISNYLAENPNQRFGQILFNLDINQFRPNKDELKDIYNDLDEEILERIKQRLEKLNLK